MGNRSQANGDSSARKGSVLKGNEGKEGDWTYFTVIPYARPIVSFIPAAGQKFFWTNTCCISYVLIITISPSSLPFEAYAFILLKTGWVEPRGKKGQNEIHF